LENNFDSLPILKKFDGLKYGSKVYSKKHGLGKVAELYSKDEVIVQFSDLRKRFSELDKEIALIPEENQKKISKKMEIFVGEEKVSFKEFKRRMDIDKRRQKYEDDLKKMNEKENAKKGRQKESI